MKATMNMVFIFPYKFVAKLGLALILDEDYIDKVDYKIMALELFEHPVFLEPLGEKK